MDEQTLIQIAEKFCEWLEVVSKEYNLDKDDVQAIIKQFLM